MDSNCPEFRKDLKDLFSEACTHKNVKEVLVTLFAERTTDPEAIGSNEDYDQKISPQLEFLGGSTDLIGGCIMALSSDQHIVFIFTDGGHNASDKEKAKEVLVKFMEEQIKQKPNRPLVIAFGIGRTEASVDSDTLKAIARITCGEYLFVNSTATMLEKAKEVLSSKAMDISELITVLLNGTDNQNIRFLTGRAGIQCAELQGGLPKELQVNDRTLTVPTADEGIQCDLDNENKSEQEMKDNEEENASNTTPQSVHHTDPFEGMSTDLFS